MGPCRDTALLTSRYTRAWPVWGLYRPVERASGDIGADKMDKRILSMADLNRQLLTPYLFVQFEKEGSNASGFTQMSMPPDTESSPARSTEDGQTVDATQTRPARQSFDFDKAYKDFDVSLIPTGNESTRIFGGPHHGSSVDDTASPSADAWRRRSCSAPAAGPFQVLRTFCFACRCSTWTRPCSEPAVTTSTSAWTC